MKNILGWSSFLLESISSVAGEVGGATATQTTNTTTLDPNIEYSTDREGNPVEYNKKKRLETTFHKEKKDSKGRRLIIKRGHYDNQNKKDGLWKEWDHERDIETSKNYYSDKLHGLVSKNYKKPLKSYDPVFEEETWTYGKIIQYSVEYKNGDNEERKFVDGDPESYTSVKKDSEGRTIWEKKYKKTRQDGLWRWYEDGKFKCSMNYTRGEPDGWGKNPEGEVIRGSTPKNK